MKIEELKKLIRNVVKEEVHSQINKIAAPLIIEILNHFNKKENNSSREITEERVQKIKVPKLKTNNEKINSVLEEMSENFNPLPRDSMVDVDGGGFDKIGGDETEIINPVTHIDFLKQIISESTPVNSPVSITDSNNVPDSLKKIFKKDFRSLMKAIDKQKQGKSS